MAEAPRVRAVAVDDAAIAIRPGDIRVEVRGAGRSTRQINHIIAPDFPADRLLLVEVLTPAGNWSSWPPHKHDVDDMPNEAVLEEIYHYRLPTPGSLGDPARLPAVGQPARAAARRGRGPSATARSSW